MNEIIRDMVGEQVLKADKALYEGALRVRHGLRLYSNLDRDYEGNADIKSALKKMQDGLELIEKGIEELNS